MSSTNVVDETQFRTLLRRWNHHQTLRCSGAPIASLAASRAMLDAARNALRT